MELVPSRPFPRWLFPLACSVFISSGLANERYLITRSCISLQLYDDCTDPRVGKKTAEFQRWFSLFGGPVGVLATPILGWVCDQLKAQRPNDVAARIPVILFTQVVGFFGRLFWWLHSWRNWPQWMLLPLQTIEGTTGGALAMLPMLFSILADSIPLAQRARPFLCLELCIFLGGAAGTLATGKLLGAETIPEKQLRNQQRTFAASTAVSLLNIVFCLVLLSSRWRSREQPSSCASSSSSSSSSSTAGGSARVAAAEPKPQPDTESTAAQSTFRADHLRAFLLSLPIALARVADGRRLRVTLLVATFLLAAGTLAAISPIMLLYTNELRYSAEDAALVATLLAVMSAPQLFLALFLIRLFDSTEMVNSVLALLASTGPFFLLAGTTVSVTFLFPFASSAAFSVFPLTRTIFSGLVPMEMVGLTLAGLGMLENISTSVFTASFLTIYGSSELLALVGLSMAMLLCAVCSGLGARWGGTE